MESSTGPQQDNELYYNIAALDLNSNSPVCVDHDQLEEFDGSTDNEPDREVLSNSQINRSNPKRRSYTLDEKLEALKVMDSLTGNLNATAKKLKIARKNLYRWRQQKQLIMDQKNGKGTMRTFRRIRPVGLGKWPQLEDELKNWFNLRRERGLSVNRLHLKSEARRLATSMGIDIQFTCSNGWLSRFLNRHNLSLRTPTSIGQNVPVDARDLAIQFLSYIGDLRNKYSSSNRLIYGNMDEVPVWFDSPKNRTYDFVGNRSIFVRTTNHQKTRFTVVLATLSTGQKLSPMVIFKASNRRIAKEPEVEGIIMTGSENGSMNTEVMEKWRSKVWCKRPDHIRANINHRLSNLRTVLVMDSFNVHKDSTMLGKLDRLNNTEVAIIPGGMTKFLQPADVVYNRCFKSHMRTEWQKWMETGPFEYTRSGNRKHASYHQVCQWTKAAWDAVPVEMIKESYHKCGIIDEDESERFHIQLLDLITGNNLNNEENDPTGVSDEEPEDFD